MTQGKLFKDHLKLVLLILELISKKSINWQSSSYKGLFYFGDLWSSTRNQDEISAFYIYILITTIYALAKS